jgi:2-hydroxy-3-keto-5-methylthiopentenyl-1-phosphate phosphatase
VESIKGDACFKIGDEKTARSSVADVYAAIEADLVFASANLNATASQKRKSN